MATTSYRLINLSPNVALRLMGETWSRKLPYGKNWTRLRFGFLGTVGDSNLTAVSIADCALMLGVSSSKPLQVGDYDGGNMCGCCPTGDPTSASRSTMAYVATSYPSFSSTGVNPKFFTRTYSETDGVSWVTTATAVAICAYAPDITVTSMPVPVVSRNGIYILDISRNVGGTGGTMRLYHPVVADMQAGYFFTESDLMDAINAQGIPVVQGLTLAATASTQVSIGENTGELDSLFISWTKRTIPFNITAIGGLVQMDTTLTAISGAADDFTTYGTPTLPPYTTSGSFNGGDWYTTTQSSWLDYGTGFTSAMSPGNLAGTTTGLPYDPMVQYIVSSTAILAGVVNGGTGWAGAAIFAGTISNTSPQIGLAGTSTGAPFDLMVQYNTGTLTGEVIEVVINAGTGWSGNGVFR